MLGYARCRTCKEMFWLMKTDRQALTRDEKLVVIEVRKARFWYNSQDTARLPTEVNYNQYKRIQHVKWTN